MRIKLNDWNARNFTPPISPRALARLRTEARIQPPPRKFGGAWYVDEKAEVVADESLEATEARDLDDPVVIDILRARA